MTYIYRTACAIGWIGMVIVAPGLLDGGAPIWTSFAVAAVSAPLAVWGGWRAGMMQ